jgi:hypothetical protein
MDNDIRHIRTVSMRIKYVRATESGKVTEIKPPSSTFEETVMQSRGLGDTVAKLTKSIGIVPCDGCKKRQSKLNKLFPYKVK